MVIEMYFGGMWFKLEPGEFPGIEARPICVDKQSPAAPTLILTAGHGQVCWHGQTDELRVRFKMQTATIRGFAAHAPSFIAGLLVALREQGEKSRRDAPLPTPEATETD